MLVHKRETETVVSFTVTLTWDNWRSQGVRSVTVGIEGCSTSSEAIEKAIATVKPLREDAPKNASSSCDTWEREKPAALLGVIDV